MSDLDIPSVLRLQYAYDSWPAKAADEIERLRAENAALAAGRFGQGHQQGHIEPGNRDQVHGLSSNGKFGRR